MRTQLCALLAITLVLAGCQTPPPKAADTGDTAAVATGDQTVPKKKCTASTGSRMGSCDGVVPDVTGSTGEAYKNSTFGKATQATPPF